MYANRKNNSASHYIHCLFSMEIKWWVWCDLDAFNINRKCFTVQSNIHPFSASMCRTLQHSEWGRLGLNQRPSGWSSMLTVSLWTKLFMSSSTCSDNLQLWWVTGSKHGSNNDDLFFVFQQMGLTHTHRQTDMRRVLISVMAFIDSLPVWQIVFKLKAHCRFVIATPYNELNYRAFI